MDESVCRHNKVNALIQDKPQSKDVMIKNFILSL
jgi:hypothetical protein